MVKKRVASAIVAVPKSGARKIKVKKDVAVKEVTKDAKKGELVQLRLRVQEYAGARAVKLKLGHFPKSQVERNRDSSGRHILPKVIAELQRLKPLKGYIKQEYWHALIRDHNLSGGFASDLPQAQTEQVVDKDLNNFLSLCHEPNPAARSCSKLLRWLSYAKGVNQTEFMGILAGCAESPSLSRAMSSTILEGVLKFVARTRADSQHGEVWSSVKDTFDTLLVRQWARSQSKGTTRTQFLRTWRAELNLFMAMTDV